MPGDFKEQGVGTPLPDSEANQKAKIFVVDLRSFQMRWRNANEQN